MLRWFRTSQKKRWEELTNPLQEKINYWREMQEVEHKVVKSLTEANDVKKELLATQEAVISELKKIIDKQSFDALVLNKKIEEQAHEIESLSMNRTALIGELNNVVTKQQRHATKTNNDIFWIIWCPMSDSKPTIKHWSFEAAQQESVRLAQKNEGKEFFVLKMEGMAVTNKSAFYDHRDSQIPF